VFLVNNTQKLAARILETHIAQDRVAHAYILSGRDGSSQFAEMAAEGKNADVKEEFAVAFASALLGGQKKLFAKEQTALSERIWKHAHPDVRWIGEDPEERSIKIETVREVIHWASLKPYESVWKFCVVLKAERLTDEAANAFLKTLEEPPKHTVFILTVENKTNLLETIQSRSFEVRLAPAPVQEIPKNVASIEAMPVKMIFDSYTNLQKPELKKKLDGLMTLAREKIYYLVSEDPAGSREAARHEMPGRGLSGIEAARWLEALDLVYDSKAALEANANQKLLVTRLAMRLRRLFPIGKAAL
jgi:DNA polymerase-3 subunit delta'